MTENTENIETLGLSPEDAADIQALTADLPYRTLLELWHEVLTNVPAQAAKPVGLEWAIRIVGSYQQIEFGDLQAFSDAYFAKLKQLADILDIELAGDKKALSYTTPEEDAVENAAHYKNLLLTWQLAIAQWRLEWSCTDPDAAIQVAAMAEAQTFFFSPNGLVQWLDNIPFEFTPDDQETLQQALLELHEEAS